MLQGEVASADDEAVPDYLIKFKDIVAENGFSPRQTFNVDETGPN